MVLVDVVVAVSATVAYLGSAELRTEPWSCAICVRIPRPPPRLLCQSTAEMNLGAVAVAAMRLYVDNAVSSMSAFVYT